MEQSKISVLPFTEQASRYSPFRPWRCCLLPDRTIGSWSRSAAYAYRPPVLFPPICLSWADFQIRLLAWGSLAIWPRQWGIFKFLPCQKKIQNVSSLLSNISSSVQLQTLTKLCLCLLYMNVTEVRTPWKGAGRTGCLYVNCGRGFTLVNSGIMKRMTPRVAHPLLISKHSIVNIE